MKIYNSTDFNKTYLDILKDLMNKPMYKVTNRKGETLHEITNFNLVLSDLNKCYCFCRNLNLHYLIGELLFYLKGENKLENIEYYSKFWKRISDDEINLNSCYGYYIWKQPLNHIKVNQYRYCLHQLLRNKESKKAVITIYSAVHHSKETKDNPCTMFLQFYIRENKLYLKTHMRSNDIWFGLPYDLPFFVMLQKMMYIDLKNQTIYDNLELGDYIHSSNSLHLYEKDFKAVSDVIKKPYKEILLPEFTQISYSQLNSLIDFENVLKDNCFINPTLYNEDYFIKFFKKILLNFKMFNELKNYAEEKSTCLKKKVACYFLNSDLNVITKGYNGRPNIMVGCTECVAKKEEFFHDTCNSLHAEERAILELSKQGYNVYKLKNTTCYLTHAPCDQCLKFMIELGVKKVIFKEPYKTHYERYKGLIEIEDGFGRKYV